MSLLGQLKHDPPALDFGGPDHVLHLFQCQDCFGYESGHGNDAIFVSAQELGDALCEPPAGLERLVGELWIKDWIEEDDGLPSELAKDLFDTETWMQLPDAIVQRMFDWRRRTKMGGVPYWTGNGPLHRPKRGYEFLFQLDTGIEINGSLPQPDDIGGMVIVVESNGKQGFREPKPGKKKRNAPWTISQFEGELEVQITNLGTDGTAYFMINRKTVPPKVYWFWNR